MTATESSMSSNQGQVAVMPAPTGLVLRRMIKVCYYT
jgi:hypothetical protein